MSLDRKASFIPLPHLDMPMLLAVPGDYCIESADARGARMTMCTDMAYGSARVRAQPGSPPPMPVGDPGEIVAGLHSRIVSEAEAESGTDMGIIEVGTGITGEARREYSCFIMKMLCGTDLSYWLRLDLHAGDDFVCIEGLFEEVGVTGIRAAMVMASLLARGGGGGGGLRRDARGGNLRLNL